jgi:predicted dienelactone hydrolase
VEALLFTWNDAQRRREVPVKVYLPREGKGPWPVVLVSHGLGGSRETYAYLGNHWAGHGYVSVHLQHPGSDEAVWRGSAQPMQALRQALARPENALNRPKDVGFALDRLAALNHSEPRFQGRLNLNAVGAAGHSFGAFTVQALAGQVFTLPLGREVTLADRRIRAGVVMSPTVPRKTEQVPRAFSRIGIPLLHLTGTRDHSVITDTRGEERRLPFDHTTAKDQYLVILKDGDHFTFVGPGRPRGGGERESRRWDLVRMITTAFWDAYLKGDPEALAWLSRGYAQALGADGALEKK